MQIKTKQRSKLMRLIGALLRPINPEFMTHYVTTIGRTIYVPETMTAAQVDAILPHEKVHVQQFEKWGAWFVLSYLLILPMGPSVRAYWEWQAYKVDINRRHKERGTVAPWYRQRIVDQFTGSYYGWMWPFPKHMRRVVDRYCERLDA